MDKTLRAPKGQMWQVGPRGEIVLLEDGIWLPNTLCWSPDGGTLYFADSLTKLLWAYDYDLDTGLPSNRRLFADTSDAGGAPDGSSVDVEGYVWNARFDGACLMRFAPDGRLDQVIPVPVSRPTHVTFGGPELETMYVTTARFRLKPDTLAAQPMAGGVLAIETDVAGLPEPLWG